MSSERSAASPRATYRVQLHAGFDFDAAAGIAEYLAALGVSHLYASPSLQAAPGSTHGYDVVDPLRVNAELGGEAGHLRLQAALCANGLGHVLDIVPNHMAIGSRENAWWWDVLENGPSSRYAAFFDVDWDPPEAKLRNRVLLPILGEHYGVALAQGAIGLQREGGNFTVTYYDNAAPVAPRTLDAILAPAAERCDSDELAFLADTYAQLPPATATDAVSVGRRHRDKEVLRAHLAALAERDRDVAAAIDAVVAEIAGSPEALDALLERQNYRLTYWRAAERELDYRRFFDINSLVGLRVEDVRVFAGTHTLILRWLDEGVLDGVRIDHVDGLRDPDVYLQRLRERAPGARIWVEKILEPGEQLPGRWPVAGSTGYDFLNVAGGLFLDPAAEEPLTAFYTAFTDETADYPALVHEKKLLVLRESLGSDVNRLTALLLDVCQQHWCARDFTRHELQEALREVVADCPVYRTYVQAEGGRICEEDRRLVERTIDDARERRPDLDDAIFSFLRDVLNLQVTGRLEAEFVMRFQQLTGPAMAKGMEDTACYCYNRLVALNEVGGDPGKFGYTPQEFHAYCCETQQRFPETLLASSTHDTKRSEDVRARLAALTEAPEAWCAAVSRWAERNEQYKKADGWPDRNAEYLLYQTLVGAWPIDVERATAYMLKAVREAKQHTSWTEQNEPYEAGLQGFVKAVLEDKGFVQDLEAFVATIRDAGWVKSLAQTLLKLTAPGVPDIYQGTELWDLSLVDPDNRRPVDYALRRRLLGDLAGLTPEAIWERRDEGLPKLWTVCQALDLRRAVPHAFGPAGDYAPLTTSGANGDALVAFTRGDAVATIVPRFGQRMQQGWGDTSILLPEGRWRNVLTGEGVEGGTVRPGAVLWRFPVAVLVREEVA